LKYYTTSNKKEVLKKIFFICFGVLEACCDQIADVGQENHHDSQSDEGVHDADQLRIKVYFA
jgi:hypothetical protein